jgi:hypothetical protein
MTSHLTIAVRVLVVLVVLAAAAGLGKLGATFAAFSATTQTGASTFTAAASFGCPDTVSPLWLTGFEHGGSILTDGGGIFDDLTGAPTADSAVKNHGAYSLKVLDASAANAINGAKTTTATSSFVTRFAIRLDSLPVSAVTELARVDAAAGNDLQLGYDAATQKLRLALGTTATPVATVTAATTISAGTWYVIDLRLATSTTARTGSWRIDGAAQTAVTNTEAASSSSKLSFGSTIVDDLFTANYDDVKVSATAADYPLAYGRILKLSPNSLGTPLDTTHFAYVGDSSPVTAGDWAYLDDVPLRGGFTSVLDGIKQNVSGGTNYLQVNFADTAETCITGVWALGAGFTSQAPAQSAKLSIFDGGTERLIHNGTWPASTTQAVRSAAVLPASSPWTTATLNALIARFGYSSDATRGPAVNGLMLEYEVGMP